MEEKKKFHIVITDNETGEVIHDTDACAIIGGVSTGTATCALVATDCGPFDMAITLASAEEAAESIYNRHPELKPLTKFIRTKDTAEEPEIEEPKNEE